jgi:hypothetical protein
LVWLGEGGWRCMFTGIFGGFLSRLRKIGRLKFGKCRYYLLSLN